jgi:peptide/nickel transport system permease protein
MSLETTPQPALTAPADETILVPTAEPVPRSNWQLFRRRFLRHKTAVISLVVLTLLFLMCFGASWIAPYPKNKVFPLLIADAHGPTAKHWFGTTDSGQDLFSQMLYGGQISLKIGLAVAVLSTVAGVIVGAIAGFLGGWIDQALSRLTDLFLIVPELAVLAVALKRLGQTQFAFIIVLAALGWMYVARVVRGQVLSIKEKEFVEAARASGASNARIIVRHVLPNCIGVIMVNATLAIALAVIAESTLTFLGLGLQPPNTSWGILLRDAEGAAADPNKFFLVAFPAAFLIITVMAVNFIGDGLRDALDPQSKS